MLLEPDLTHVIDAHQIQADAASLQRGQEDDRFLARGELADNLLPHALRHRSVKSQVAAVELHV